LSVSSLFELHQQTFVEQEQLLEEEHRNRVAEQQRRNHHLESIDPSISWTIAGIRDYLASCT
jgi:hypothetical protein